MRSETLTLPWSMFSVLSRLPVRLGSRLQFISDNARTLTMPEGVHKAFRVAIEKHEPGTSLQQKASHIQSSSGKTYFAKIGSKHEIEQFVGEAEALKAMHIAAPGLAPQLIACGTLDEDTTESDSEVGRPFFVSEYKDMTSLTEATAKRLGKRLATEMHAYESTQGFGFGVPTFCGRTRQDNGWFDSWQDCYDALIGGLLDKLEAEGGYEELCKKGKQVRERSRPIPRQGPLEAHSHLAESYLRCWGR